MGNNLQPHPDALTLPSLAGPFTARDRKHSGFALRAGLNYGLRFAE